MSHKYSDHLTHQGIFVVTELDVAVWVQTDSYYARIFEDRREDNYETGFWMLNYYVLQLQEAQPSS